MSEIENPESPYARAQKIARAFGYGPVAQKHADAKAADTVGKLAATRRQLAQTQLETRGVQNAARERNQRELADAVARQQVNDALARPFDRFFSRIGAYQLIDKVYEVIWKFKNRKSF